MIAVDTNVLARLFVADDPRQHLAAKTFFAERSSVDPAFVSTVVIAELAWLLGKAFDYKKADIIALFTAVLGSPDFVLERRDIVQEALEISASSKAGVADAIIAGVASQEGARATMTFDIDAAKSVPGMELLK